jgi:hypothetical protein
MTTLPPKRRRTRAVDRKVTVEPYGATGPDAQARLQSIRERAYAFYLRRGRVDGHALDDWLRAETEIDQVVERGRQSLEENVG